MRFLETEFLEDQIKPVKTLTMPQCSILNVDSHDIQMIGENVLWTSLHWLQKEFWWERMKMGRMAFRRRSLGRRKIRAAIFAA
jgi:hypothetical protein